MKKIVIIGSLILAMAVGLGSCGEKLDLKPGYYPFESWEAYEAAETNAKLLLFERLQNMAQTRQARDYVACFLPPTSNGGQQYDPDSKAWLAWLHGSLATRLVQEDGFFSGPIGPHTWLPSDYLDTGILGDHFYTAEWMVYDSGRIVPLSNGFRVESDIEHLNIAETLE